MKTRALTVSEINQIFLEKGLSPLYIYKIPENKWNADCMSFSECDGQSNLVFWNFKPYDDSGTSGTLTAKFSYRKLKAAEKKEVQKFIEDNFDKIIRRWEQKN